MFKRVLVPLDGSMLSETALEPALHLAQQTDGTVYLMRVPVYVDSGSQASSEYHRVWAADNNFPEHEDISSYLRETRESITRQGVSVRIIIGEGDRSNAILNTAVTKNADLILMASHARSGVSRWLLGSISGKIIRQTHTPVMLVRQPSDFNHILITLDGSELAEHVIDPAIALAEGFGSRVTFLQIIDGKGNSTVVSDEDRNDASEASYMDGVLERYLPQELDLKTATMRGPVAETILSYAAENDVDLIAMSTHGRSGLQKFIFGSITEKVMCDSGCAMLITRPPDEEMT